MRKLLSIILAVVMLAGMMTVAIPASAEVVDAYASLETQAANAEATELYIEDATDYVYFYNNRGSFTGKTLKLVADIDLNPEWNAEIVATTVTTPAGPGADGVEGTEDDVAESSTTIYSVNEEGLVTKLANGSAAVWFGGSDAAVLTTLDGQGHTVSGVYVDGHTANQAAGMIGRMRNAVVKNINYSNCLVYSQVARAGGIGTTVNLNTYFENVFADIDILGSSHCGGFVGLNTNGASCNTYLTNCVYAGELVSTGDIVGGFVGYSWDDSDSYLTNCAFYGTITLTKDGARAGKLVGGTGMGTSSASAKRDIHSKIIVENCVAAGTVNNFDATINGAFVGSTVYMDACVSNATNQGKKHYTTITVNNSIYTPVAEKQTAIGTCVMSDAVKAYAEMNVYTATETNSAAITANGIPALTTEVYDLSATWTQSPAGPLPTALLGVIDGGSTFDEGCVFLGYQVKAVEGGYAIRFIGEVYYDDALNSVGMRVGVEGGNLEGLVSKAKTTTKVYKGLIVGAEGGEDDYVAAEGKAVYTLNVGTFTADMGVITVHVTTFVDAGEGDYICQVKTITIDTSKLAELAG